jgi:alpha-beta hydrolase superfamily lysophospholipase
MLNEIREIVAETKSHLQPLSTKNTYSYSTALYFKHYGLDLIDQNTEHLFGTFQSNGFALAGHIFKPINYKATVFILHGYLNHCGLLSKIIRYLIESGFAVAVYDLPGHGLSGGKPTEIEDFSDYTDSLSDFMNTVRPILHGPYHLIGHSSGAAVIMDYLFAGRSDCFDKIVLTAPLVRSDLWFLSKLGYKIYRPFAKNIFRLFRNVSSDKDFLRFVKYRDPLQATKVSVKWIDAFFRWNDKIASAESIARPIMIIQGTRENIVAWKYNLKFIQSKFGKAEIKLIENGRHELLNESADICKEVFSQIGSYLES